MKTEDLQKQGLTQEQINYVMGENGKDIKRLQDEVTALTSERDQWKSRAESAEAVVEKLPKDVEPDKIAQVIDQAKTDLANAKTDFDRQMAERDFKDAVRTAMEGYKFSSAAAKKAVSAEAEASGLTLKDGKILGLGELMEDIKSRDASAFAADEPDKPQKKVRFTDPIRRPAGEDKEPMTRETIAKMRDPRERRAAIAAHPELFNTTKEE